MEDEVRRIVDGYIDEVIEAGSCDLVTDISGPFPMDVISAVLGIPEHDRDALRVSADKILIREDGSMQIPEEAMNGMFELLGYFVQDLESRRAGDRTGLITDLLDAEVDGQLKTRTTGLLCAVRDRRARNHDQDGGERRRTLSRHPDQQALLAADPERMATAVEEVLGSQLDAVHAPHLDRRYRASRSDDEAGDSVLLLIGAANHDEREFGEYAEVFDVRTPTGTSASAMAPTSAWVRRSPASKGVSLRADPRPSARLRRRSRTQGALSFLQRRVGRASPSRSVPGCVELHHELAGDRLTIDGELVAAEGARPTSIDPSTGQEIGVAADASPADIERALVAARRAFDRRMG